MKAYIIIDTINGNTAKYIFFDRCSRKWREDELLNLDAVLSRGYRKTKKFDMPVYEVEI